MAETEDVPYSVSEFATPEDEKQPDEDQPNKSVLVEMQKYLREAIAEHNTFDVVNLPDNATKEEKVAAFDMMAIHKGLVMHLRTVKTMIDNKIKELA